MTVRMEPTATPRGSAGLGERGPTVASSAAARRRKRGPRGNSAVFCRWNDGCHRHRKRPGNGSASTGAHRRAPLSKEKIRIRPQNAPARAGIQDSRLAEVPNDAKTSPYRIPPQGNRERPPSTCYSKPHVSLSEKNHVCQPFRSKHPLRHSPSTRLPSDQVIIPWPFALPLRHSPS